MTEGLLGTVHCRYFTQLDHDLFPGVREWCVKRLFSQEPGHFWKMGNNGGRDGNRKEEVGMTAL